MPETAPRGRVGESLARLAFAQEAMTALAPPSLTNLLTELTDAFLSRPTAPCCPDTDLWTRRGRTARREPDGQCWRTLHCHGQRRGRLERGCVQFAHAGCDHRLLWLGHQRPRDLHRSHRRKPLSEPGGLPLRRGHLHDCPQGDRHPWGDQHGGHGLPDSDSLTALCRLRALRWSRGRCFQPPLWHDPSERRQVLRHDLRWRNDWERLSLPHQLRWHGICGPAFLCRHGRSVSHCCARPRQ